MHFTQSFRSIRFLLTLSLLMGYSATGMAQVQPNEPITIGTSFFKSLVLPGWGERSLGYTGRANKFAAAEATIWLGYGLLQVLSDRTHDEMIDVAVNSATVNPAGKSGSYYDDVGNYMDLAAYNDQMLRDRNPYLTYPVNQGYEWFWPSETERKTFKDIKFKRNLYSHFTLYALGAVTINHVVSAFDAIWLQKNGMSLEATPLINSDVQGMALSLKF